MNTIRIDCKGAENLTIEQLEPFQGELKDLSRESFENLRDDILNTGFAFPFHVWQNAGKNYIIGGHQRLRVLQTLQNQGYEIPPVPVDLVFAESYELAKRRVLQDINFHGTVSQQGLYQYAIEWGIKPIELAKIKIPEINMPKFIESHFASTKEEGEEDDEEPKTEPSEQRSASDGVRKIVLQFDEDTAVAFERYCGVMAHKYDTKSITDTVFRCLEEAFNS